MTEMTVVLSVSVDELSSLYDSNIADYVSFFCRENYGNDIDNKPNDHCVWSQLFFIDAGYWEEDDAHFRERINKGVIKQ